MMKIFACTQILLILLLLAVTLGCKTTQSAVVEYSTAVPASNLTNAPNPVKEKPVSQPKEEPKKEEKPSSAKNKEKTPIEESAVDLEEKKPPTESKIFPSSKERPLTSDVKTDDVPEAILAKMEGRWLPLGFLRDLNKSSSMLQIGFFPPIASIDVMQGVVSVTLTNGRQVQASVAMRKKNGEINVVVGQRTYIFTFKGNEFVWDMGQRKNSIVYRKPKDPEETYDRLLNEAMIAGKYYSMMTRTSIIFYDDGKIAGMGKRYNRYRFAQNQQELDRSNRRFDTIFLYHSQNPTGGKWFAIVPDERNKTTVLANIRERENQWHLSSTAYMLKPVDSK